MPSVHVDVWEGWGEENARKVIQEFTKVFTDMGIPAQAVSIIINEVPKTHWGVGGEPCSISMKDAQPPK